MSPEPGQMHIEAVDEDPHRPRLQVLERQAPAGLIAERLEHIEVPGTGTPGRYLHPAEGLRIQDHGECSCLVVAHSTDAEKRLEVTQCRRETAEILVVIFRKDVDVFGSSFRTVEPGGDAADEQVLDSVLLERSNNAVDVEVGMISHGHRKSARHQPARVSTPRRMR